MHRNQSTTPTPPDDANPHPARRITYSGLYSSAATVNLILGALYLTGDVAVLFASAYAQAMVIAQVTPFLLFDGLLFAGAIGTFLRAGWARQATRLFGAVMLPVSLLAALVLLSQRGHTLLPSELKWVVFAGIGVRALHAALCWLLYSNIRADVYFGQTRRPPRGFPVIGPPAPPEQERPAAPSPSTARRHASQYRFRLKGTELATGKQVEIMSRAQTEHLARISAGHLGLDPQSLTIEPVAPNTLDE